MSVEEAESLLKKAGFEVAVELEQISSDTIVEGNIVKTSPAAGRMIKKGTMIILYQSTGQNYLIVENYIGKDYNEIKAVLNLAGITVKREKKDVPDAEIEQYRDKEDLIIEQDIKAGAKLKEGDEITLYTPNIYDVYPDMEGEGWTESDAKAFADKYGITLNITYVPTNEYAPGLVINQSRPADSKIVAGVTLRIDVSAAVEEPIEDPTEEDEDTE